MEAVLAAVLSAAAQPTPPQLPKAFSVTIEESEFTVGGEVGSFVGGRWRAGSGWGEKKSFYYDNATDGTIRQRLNGSDSFSGAAWTMYTPSNNTLALHAMFANDCRPIPLDFTFGSGLDITWLPRAKFAGEVRVGFFKKGNAFFYQSKQAFYNYTAVVSQDEPARLLWVAANWTGSLPGTNSSTMRQTARHTFGSDLTVAAQPPSLFVIPVEGCFEKVPPCPNATSAVLDVYLAHPHAYRNLEDQDTGDARGDVMFICPDISSPYGMSDFNEYDEIAARIVSRRG